MQLKKSTVLLDQSLRVMPSGVSKQAWEMAITRAHLIPAILHWVGTTKQGCPEISSPFGEVFGLSDGDPVCDCVFLSFAKTRRVEVVVSSWSCFYLAIRITFFGRGRQKLEEFMASVRRDIDSFTINFQMGPVE